MNFLAHSILSPPDPLVMLGNLCGDFIKGSKMEGVNPFVADGVRLHRDIDSYTDSHPLIKEAKAIVRTDFKLFSGIVIDMFFDHFVAKNHTSLEHHVKYVYDSGKIHTSELPESFNKVLYYMVKFNWLQAYAEKDKLRAIMLQMRKRIGDKSPLDKAVDILIQEENLFDKIFQEFWIDAQKKFNF